jgi:hypothetical protein
MEPATLEMRLEEWRAKALRGWGAFMETPIGPGPTGMNLNNIKVCARCQLRYDWRKSPSSMKMTYCGSLCERADLGFTIEALLRAQRVVKEEAVAPGV